jgi:signal transduction histidine kinase
LLWAVIGLSPWHDHGLAEAGPQGDAANPARTFEQDVAPAIARSLLPGQADQVFTGRHDRAAITMPNRNGQAMRPALYTMDPGLNAADRRRRNRLLNSASSDGFQTISTIDGIERNTGSRRAEHYPLVLAVLLAATEVFAGYAGMKALYIAAGILLSTGIICAALVIERQRRSILKSRQALAVALENMTQGIAMVDADGSVPVYNQRGVELMGLPPELMAGRPKINDIVAWQIAHNDFADLSTLDPVLASLINDRTIARFPYVYERTRPNGTIIEVRSQPLAQGGTVCTYTDISERKANEAALAEARTRAAHAERMQALGQLAGGIAHDFNNILQAVKGAANLIDQGAPNMSDTARFARMILEATDRGSSITRRLLAFSRRGELRAESVDLAALLHDLQDVLHHTLGTPVSVAVDIAADLPPVLADKGQLETALVNLATNARDAMPEGGTLCFTVVPDTVQESDAHPADLRGGHYVRMAISDNGLGMDPATLARAFEPFFTTKPIGKGTGLGLSMVKGFAEQSGGAMGIDSVPGRGTIVTLWLPAADRLDRVKSSLAAAPVRASADRPKRILLVDHEAMIRDALAVGLEDAGYAVTVAECRAEAVSLLQTQQMWDVLITDLSMPGMDGLAVIQEAHRCNPGLPAILLTGYAGESVQPAVGDRLDRLFTLIRKPIGVAQLSDRIEAMLAEAPA